MWLFRVTSAKCFRYEMYVRNFSSQFSLHSFIFPSAKVICRHPLAGFSLLWCNDIVQSAIKFHLILLKLWLILNKILAVEKSLLLLKFYINVQINANTDKSKPWHLASSHYLAYTYCKWIISKEWNINRVYWWI